MHEAPAIAGGFHLVAASDPAIDKIVMTLHDTYKADYIAPGHCTGEPTFTALQKTFGDHYLYAGLGTILDLGGTHPGDSPMTMTPAARARLVASRKQEVATLPGAAAGLVSVRREQAAGFTP
jgi:hypothetical protein